MFGRLNEGAHFGVVLFAGSGFDTARHINGIGADAPHGFSHVFGGKPAGEEDGATQFLRLKGEVPIELLSSAADLVRRIGIEEPGVRLVVGKALELLRVADAKGFHAHQAKLHAVIGWFVTVELEQVEATFGDGAIDQVLRRIDEHAHLDEERRKLANDRAGLLDGNGARTLVVENETQGIGTGLGGSEAVRSVGDAADFDFDCHVVRTTCRGAGRVSRGGCRGRRFGFSAPRDSTLVTSPELWSS